MVAVIYAFNLAIAITGTLILIYLIYYKIKAATKSEERWKELVENLALDIDTATQNILLELPFPLVILKEDDTVLWYNSDFRNILGDRRNLLNKSLKQVFEDLDIEKFYQREDKFITYYYEGNHYRVYTNSVKNINSEKIRMLYWIDYTEYEELMDRYLLERPVIAFIQVDNYDEVLKSSKDSYKPLITAIIDRKINAWAKDMNAYVNKYDPDQYLMMFEYEYLSVMEEKRFNILDIMRETQSGNKIPITLSIGVGISDQKLSFPQLQELSKSALDIALARGGDQAVLRKDGKLSYFGGKTQAVEKRTKVKARIKAHGIKELMENSENVLVMGHENPDIDSLGAALGIFRCARFLGKEASIVLDKSNPSIDVLYKELMENGYETALSSSESARKAANEDTVLVIVDVHKRNLVQDPDLIDKVGKIIVIDHHIRAAEFIEESVLTYLEPYASSTCELVSEIIEYIDDGVELTEIEATALLAGIYMDTKNFAIKTGVRTFEAASFLRKNGADTLKAKKLLKDDREVLIAKSQALKEAQFIKGNIAIAIVNDQSDKANLITAQTADELMNIQGVEASFVIALGDNTAIISGRSYGGLNVQRILETLGGGGHMTVAGAQLTDTDIETAREMLKNAIDEYLKEGEDK
ncbi:DHH family phosphoesterase [Alkalibacter saccharofermentans]|uniref:Cyclic-di-AMP phosphodiesterase n=1 Tax=Alkalibacter saccharofermentans DSM 14828 TaxID=1120975 RepID=A0A1M4T4D5_9FIRM|nr:DHH family phosphoesterase [Alkalibacter saccharofermentans]SHE39382.1 c-di-AMP phosphodiesterase, consists of a GGDEF-like and DHH domains [Alkalibacter saccharofermentans DSM 14828]